MNNDRNAIQQSKSEFSLKSSISKDEINAIHCHSDKNNALIVRFRKKTSLFHIFETVYFKVYFYDHV